MEILIFSDSHGNVQPMLRVIAEHPSATHLLFCGDGVKDLADVEACFPRLIVLGVRGNCDLFGADGYPYEREVTFGSLRILMMHGHTYGTKGGYGGAVAHAGREGFDLLLCGHTHQALDTRYDLGDGGTLQVFNPGSIGKREAGGYSYGVLTIRDNGYLLSHGLLCADRV